MKSAGATLNEYLNTEKNMVCCDLYMLMLKNKVRYFYADTDIDVYWAGQRWRHDQLILSRDQIQLKGAPAVDSLSITVRCDERDILEGMTFMQACHVGTLDQAYMSLYKAYFRPAGIVDGTDLQLQNECIGAYEVFQGKVEIAGAGGIEVKLTVKSVIQGLAQPVPVRIFAPQSAYASNGSGAIVSSNTDTASMLIPLKPSSKVLINL